ncbi:MAG: hypothetical protein LC749_14700 [Actinobacteria bacterium]|nr:hypothetical protein [Actinomycetota bacterium]
MAQWPNDDLKSFMKRYPAVAECPREDLLGLWVAVATRIRQEGLVQRIGNLPADLAEEIVAQWTRGTRQHGANPAVDVIANGVTYQVKCVRRTDPRRNSITTLPAELIFDQLVIIVFEYDLSICAAFQISKDDLMRHTSELMTGKDQRRITLTAKFCNHHAVIPIPREELEGVAPPSRAVIEWSTPRWMGK